MKINKLYRLFTLACLTLFCLSGIAVAQSVGTKVSSTVVDEQGNPLSGVTVYAPEGQQSVTSADGVFNISVNNNQVLVIQKKGYESQLISLSSLAGSITLVKSDFLASEDDVINMGVASSDRRSIVGSASSVNTKDRLNYDNTQFVRDYLNGLTVGVRGSSNVRGIGEALFVIDGVFGRNPNVLNMEEVEQITVLKDANAVALYGSQARNGVIVINTKRGKINRKEVNVNVRSGFRLPISLPNYLGAADYMELRNEAFLNDGQDLLVVGFSQDQIQNTRSGLNPIQYPDVDLYDYVRPMVSTTSVISEFSGGSDKSQYYVNVGWNQSENWVNINEDINAGTNRFNVRGNIDFTVNDWITSSIDGVAIISTTKGPRANILSASTSFIPFNYAPLIPLSSIDTSNNPDLEALLSRANVFDGNLLGTAQQINSTPVASAIAGGYQNNVFRVTQFNNAINFDLSKITEGLSAKTYLSFDFYDAYTTSITNQFRTYAIDSWEDGKITGLTDFGQDRRDLSENVSSSGFTSRIGMYGLVNYTKTFAKDHSINSTFLGYYNSVKRDGVLQTDKDAHLGLQVTYDFKKKLFVDFSGAYAHSLKLAKGNRGGLSPTVGLAYILSEEDFLKDSNFVNYLKVKASGGIIKSDRGIDGYYLYDENYRDGANFTWADNLSNRKQTVTQGANPNLGFEERIDLNLGVETYLMNSLWLEANVFKTELDKQLTFLQDQYPSYYNAFRPYDNFNANLYTGFELGMNFNKTYNDLTVSLGANVLYSQTEASVRSEVNEFDYQNRTGLELSTIFGFEDLGFYSASDFSTNADGDLVLNSNLPVPNFGAVQPGDIRYADQNGDNIIDQDDRVAIGQSSSPWTYGVNLNLKYKDFTLFVLGTAQSGGMGNKLSGRFNNYYAPNGNDKYSEAVLGRWTPQTADTATFPRLSAQNNQNNFRTSTFWLYDNSYFRINRAQLTFDFTDETCDAIGVEDFSLNLQGTNLLEIAENRDIRQLNIGSNPQARTYTLGVRIAF